MVVQRGQPVRQARIIGCHILSKDSETETSQFLQAARLGRCHKTSQRFAQRCAVVVVAGVVVEMAGRLRVVGLMLVKVEAAAGAAVRVALHKPLTRHSQRARFSQSLLDQVEQQAMQAVARAALGGLQALHRRVLPQQAQSEDREVLEAQPVQRGRFPRLRAAARAARVVQQQGRVIREPAAQVARV